jgi:hypothetical protein
MESLVVEVDKVSMRKTAVAGIVFAVIVVVWVCKSCGPEFSRPPGILAPDDPVQETVRSRPKWKKDRFVVTPLARFEMLGRVISTQRYYFGSDARFVPVDIVMGWGRLSDTVILNQIDFSQYSRRYSWHTDELPVPKSEISSHTANMHMIPADDTVADLLKDLDTDDLINLQGFLVRIDNPNGRHWSSSLSRTDTGEGACELIWVESLERLP